MSSAPLRRGGIVALLGALALTACTPTPAPITVQQPHAAASSSAAPTPTQHCQGDPSMVVDAIASHLDNRAGRILAVSPSGYQARNLDVDTTSEQGYQTKLLWLNASEQHVITTATYTTQYGGNVAMDDRYVAYAQDSQGPGNRKKLFLWDSAHPDQPAQLLQLSPETNNELYLTEAHGNIAFVNGALWITAAPLPSITSEATKFAQFSLYRVDLGTGAIEVILTGTSSTFAWHNNVIMGFAPASMKSWAINTETRQHVQAPGAFEQLIPYKEISTSPDYIATISKDEKYGDQVKVLNYGTTEVRVLSTSGTKDTYEDLTVSGHYLSYLNRSSSDGSYTVIDLPTDRAIKLTARLSNGYLIAGSYATGSPSKHPDPPEKFGTIPLASLPEFPLC
ncbi:MAG: hypothetical protein ACRCWS_04705 [Propionibacteriaceae bacterium]